MISHPVIGTSARRAPAPPQPLRWLDAFIEQQARSAYESEAARFLRTSRAQLYYRIHDRVLRPEKEGARTYITPEEPQRCVEACSREIRACPRRRAAPLARPSNLTFSRSRAECDGARWPARSGPRLMFDPPSVAAGGDPKSGY